MSRRPKATKQEKILAAIDQITHSITSSGKADEKLSSLLNALSTVRSSFASLTLSDIQTDNDTELSTFLSALQAIKLDEAQKAAGLKQEDIGIAANSIAEVFLGMDSIADTAKPLPDLIVDNFAERKLGLTIDAATTHGRTALKLKQAGVNISKPSLGKADIAKIKTFFQKNGEEIQQLFSTVKITPKELHDLIAEHLKKAFDAFQKIDDNSISSETLTDLIKTLTDVAEATKAAAGLGNDFSDKKSKENLLKTIKEKLPDTSDDLLVTAAAAAFGTTERVVRFEQAQKAEAKKMIAAAAAREAVSDYQDKVLEEAMKEADNKEKEIRAGGKTAEIEAVVEVARALESSSAARKKGREGFDGVGARLDRAAGRGLRRAASEKRKQTLSSDEREQFVTTNRKEAQKLIQEGNLIAAMKSLEKASSARNRTTTKLIQISHGIEILVRNVNGVITTDLGIGAEGFEKEYLSFVMAALDVAGLEGKTELKADLLERAPQFMEEFLEQAKKKGAIDEDGTLPKEPSAQRKAEKILNKLLDAEIKNHLVKSLEKAGISNASDKLAVAQTFQGLAIHHPDTVTIRGGMIDTNTTTPLKQAKAETLGKIFEKSKPDEFTELPWWHQDLIQKYAPAILTGQSPLPPSVASILGIESSKPVGQTQRLQMTKPPHPFLVAIASFPFVQKIFPKFAKEINGHGAKEAEPVDREKRSGDFKASYKAAAKEITIETEPQEVSPAKAAAKSENTKIPETTRDTEAVNFGNGSEFLMRRATTYAGVVKDEKAEKAAQAEGVREKYDEMCKDEKLTKEQKEVLELLLDSSPSVVANVLSAIEEGSYNTPTIPAVPTAASTAAEAVLSEVGEDLIGTTDGLKAARVAVTSTRSQEVHPAIVTTEPKPRARASSVDSAGGRSVAAENVETPAPIDDDSEIEKLTPAISSVLERIKTVVPPPEAADTHTVSHVKRLKRREQEAAVKVGDENAR